MSDNQLTETNCMEFDKWIIFSLIQFFSTFFHFLTSKKSRTNSYVHCKTHDQKCTYVYVPVDVCLST